MRSESLKALGKDLLFWKDQSLYISTHLDGLASSLANIFLPGFDIYVRLSVRLGQSLCTPVKHVIYILFLPQNMVGCGFPNIKKGT